MVEGWNALLRQAGDLLERAADCGLEVGASEQDLCAARPNSAVAELCVWLAYALAGLTGSPAGAGSLPVKDAADRVKASAAPGAPPEQLDVALAALDAALDPGGAAGARLAGAPRRLLLLERLLGHLQASRLLHSAAPPPGPQLDGAAEASARLRAVANLLGADAAGEGAASLAAAADARLAALLQAAQATGGGEPVLARGDLSDAQVERLRDVDAALHAEYALRRRMLIERAQVTLQSLLRSERLEEQGCAAAAREAADKGAAALVAEPAVSVEDVFTTCAGDLLPMGMAATSSDVAAFPASVKSVLMGAVPDRGGRPQEDRAAAAAAAMPAWAPRRATGTGGGGPRGGGGGGRGHGKGKGKDHGSKGKGKG
ncbi:hypothetical protein WJX81_004060 [Elliptochloris bilobata]|uniref:Uncharacterized protein n=1 Tax=Elliptochloris bilobata TaxID=381761 RepID=A0AAW1S7J7_9CHLO